MQRITNNTHTFGGRTSQFTIDSSLRNEFGWGNHTLEKAIITTDAFRSHCVLCCSEESILIILVPNPDAPSSFSHRRNEEKYAVFFKNILDIDLEAVDVSKPSKLHNPDREVHRLTVRVFLKDNTDFFIDTYYSNQFGYAMYLSWQSTMIRKSAQIGKLVPHSDRAIAREYYVETLKCLRACNDDQHHEIMSILAEFASEVTNDLELKDVVFQSQQLVAYCSQLVHNLLEAPANIIGAEDKGTKLNVPAAVRQANGGGGKKNANGLDTEEVKQLKKVAVHRLQVIGAVLKCLQCLFFNSESVGSRLGIVCGSEVTQIQAWMRFLVPDIYEDLCELLQCQDITDEDVVAAEIEAVSQQSVQGRSAIVAEAMNSVKRRGESVGSIAQSVMTPRRNTSMNSRGNAPAGIGGYDGKVANLPPDELLALLRQCVADSQACVLFEVERVYSQGKLLHNASGHGAVAGKGIAATKYEKHADMISMGVSLGEAFTSQPNWEATVHRLVERISSLLNDMLASENMHIDGGAKGPRAEAARQREKDARISAEFNEARFGRNNSQNSMKQSSEATVEGLADEVNLSQENLPPTSPGTKVLSLRPPSSGSMATPNRPRSGASTPHSIRRGRSKVDLGLATVIVNNTNALSIPSSPKKPMGSSKGRSNSFIVENGRSVPFSPGSAATSSYAKRSINAALIASADNSCNSHPQGLPVSSSRPGTLDIDTSFEGTGAMGIASNDGNSLFAPVLQSQWGVEGGAGAAPSFVCGGEIQEPASKAVKQLEELTSPLLFSTQETLFFAHCVFINELARDSFKIREILRRELVGSFVSIMGIVNLICPRPTEVKSAFRERDRQAMHDEVWGNKTNTELPTGMGKNAAPSKKTTQSDQPVLTSVKMAPSALGFLDNLFPRKSKDVPPKAESEAPKKQARNLEKAFVATTGYDWKNDLRIFEYGKPRHGLSKSTWVLVVMAREALEQTINTL